MQLLDNLKYTNSHEWVKQLSDGIVLVGITDFAQRELGDIVYVDVNGLGKDLKAEDIFGTIEAIKTVSDLFMPLDGKVIEVNDNLASSPESINQSPYEDGWIIKIELSNPSQLNGLLSVEDYKKIVH